MVPNVRENGMSINRCYQDVVDILGWSDFGTTTIQQTRIDDVHKKKKKKTQKNEDKAIVL